MDIPRPHNIHLKTAFYASGYRQNDQINGLVRAFAPRLTDVRFGTPHSLQQTSLATLYASLLQIKVIKEQLQPTFKDMLVSGQKVLLDG